MDIDSYINGLIEEVKALFGGKPTPVGGSPMSGVGQKPISSPGGYTAPIHGQWYNSGGFTYTASGSHPKGHMGLDLRCQSGTPIYPITDGVVTNVGTDPMGGNVVNVQHANGVRSYYAHLSAARAQKGDHVTPETVLGLVGMSGNARNTVPHCHLQIWQNNRIQDPARFFSVPAYTNISAEEQRQPKWISPEAKQEAQAFNMQEHVAQKSRVASTDVERLIKLADRYYQLTKKL